MNDKKQNTEQNEKLLRAIGGIDGNYIEEAAPSCNGSRRQPKHNIVKWIAACFILLAAAAALIIPKHIKEPGRPDGDIQGDTVGNVKVNIDIARNYKDIDIKLAEFAVDWPWEYKTASEKYPVVTFEGREYSVRESRIGSIRKELTESALGECTGRGNEKFYAYSIKGINYRRMIAADLYGEYYVYICTENLPDTLGKLLSECDLPSLMELSHFTLHKGSNNESSMNLKDDSTIWKILAENGGALIADDDIQSTFQHEKYISFPATSEAMGIYNLAIYITESGFLWTNIYNAALIYDIGSDAACEIIKYAEQYADPHDTAAKETAYSYNVIGTVSFIGDGYILIDDSVLCVNPEEHMIFKVLTDNIRISRYIDYNIINEGDTVCVQYSGEIDTDAGNVIDSAMFICKAILNGEDVMIPE